jgi:hypothetical protein
LRYSLLPLLFLLANPASAADGEKQPVENVGTIMVAFGAHLDSHPLVEAEDLYKFLHQAVFGPEHAVSNRQAAADRMEGEVKDLGPPFDGELPCEPLGGEMPLVRVNLRPFVANGSDPDLLLDAFVESANRERGSGRQMETVLSLAASYVECAGRGELTPEIKQLADRAAEAAFPAIHHSEIYVEAYRPAYRVFEKHFAEDHGWCD